MSGWIVAAHLERGTGTTATSVGERPVMASSFAAPTPRTLAGSTAALPSRLASHSATAAIAASVAARTLPPMPGRGHRFGQRAGSFPGAGGGGVAAVDDAKLPSRGLPVAFARSIGDALPEIRELARLPRPPAL